MEKSYHTTAGMARTDWDRAPGPTACKVIDPPALKSLPSEPYEFSEWRTCRVGIDYHIEVVAHYYS